MRDIDFIPEVVAELAPHMPRVEQRFNEENEAFKKLLAQDHDPIGQILKCHLIIENYINKHLDAESPSHNWRAARLRFAQKLELLPQDNPKVQWVLPGIREINAIRNRYGHDLTAALSLNELSGCRKVLAIARGEKEYVEPLEVINDFTTVTCTWLIVDREIEQIFKEAFVRARRKHRLRHSPPVEASPSAS